jgi:uncharacterized protein (TIGR03084 family)
MSTLDDVLADLTAEADALDAVVAGLDDEQWRTPTPAEGWDIAHQIVHLAWTDETAVLAATDKQRWDAVMLAAIDDPRGFVDAAAASGAQDRPAAILDRWRSGRKQLEAALRGYPDGEKMPWFGPPMSPTSMATARFMETWAHALDVTDALGLVVEPTDRVRNVVHLGVHTRTFSFATHDRPAPQEEFCVELVAPSGETWTHGPADAAQRVTGSAYDFALLVTQRRHRDDLDLHATGPDADAWLDIAQAFAGPPGAGRNPEGAA